MKNAVVKELVNSFILKCYSPYTITFSNYLIEYLDLQEGLNILPEIEFILNKNEVLLVT